MDGTTIRDGVRIARVEWRRHRRERGGRWSDRLFTIALLTVAVALGAGAFAGGRAVASRPALADDVGLLATLLFVAVAWRSANVTHERFERLNPEFLLTTVPARAAALGLALFVFARVAVMLALPTLGAAIGAGLGLRSAGVAVTALLAIAGVASLAVTVGTLGRLVARLVGMRLSRGRVLRDLLIVFGWLPLVVGWFLVQYVARETSLSFAGLLALIGVQPVAWFGDLALVGGSIGAPTRGVAALATLLAIPVLVGATSAVVRRIWETEPASSSRPSVSRSVVGDGPLERVFGGRLPRPVLTVVRERLLLERRVPRGLLMTGYVVLILGVVLMPTFLLGGGAVFLLVAIVLGMAAGIAFATDPLAVEYRTLPMLVTTVDGRQFVGGLVLAALIAGVPLVAIVIVPLGLYGSVGIAATIGVALVGIAVCACTAAVTAAIDTNVDRDDLVPMPFFFTSIPTYGEPGLASFLRLAKTFAIVTLVCLPAMAGNSPLVYDHPATSAVPTGVVRLGSLLATILLATAVAAIAFRIAVGRFRAITLD
ncbi:hypothetical protein [Halopiger goleimassiliensis]|uniref:hypothetical protein n=1 Tax=Halopiger goleimassiliensis TaxID=1293048 RepID=UPI000677BCD9|nr:hypothetical protein [Halopiger goleimassiliensis]